MKKYRKKPVVIEAVRYTGNNYNEIAEWMRVNLGYEPGAQGSPEGVELAIPTLEGIMIASPGDYVIKGVAGEFYPCKPDIFEQTYEELGHS